VFCSSRSEDEIIDGDDVRQTEIIMDMFSKGIETQLVRFPYLPRRSVSVHYSDRCIKRDMINDAAKRKLKVNFDPVNMVESVFEALLLIFKALLLRA